MPKFAHPELLQGLLIYLVVHVIRKPLPYFIARQPPMSYQSVEMPAIVAESLPEVFPEDPVFFCWFLSRKAEEGGPAFLRRRGKVFGVNVLTIRG
jgi:hypothetical protein